MRNVLIIIAALAGLSGCYNNKADKLYPAPVNTCDTAGIISYDTDIVPIVTAYCYSPGNGCHDAAGSRTSGYDYTTYYGIEVNAANGDLLSDLISGTPHMMPKNGPPLPSCDLDKIIRWVDEGYPDN